MPRAARSRRARRLVILSTHAAPILPALRSDPTVSLLRLGLLTLVWLVPARIAAPPQHGLASLEEQESRILRLELHGQSDEAAQLARETVAGLGADLAGEATPEGKERVAAHGEFLLVVLERLSHATTQWVETQRALRAIPRAEIPALLAARLDHLEALCASRVGDRARVESLTRQLGYLGEWMLIGPFENERGAGYARVEEPESGFDPELVARGKERDVHWRRIPVRNPPLGRFDLGSMMRPRSQAAAYLRTAVEIAEARPLVLRLGSAEAIRVWCNGELVHARDARRPHRPDQDAVAFAARAGWNEILVKVCTQEEDWAFSCRLTEPDGTPLPNAAIDPERAVSPPAGETERPVESPRAAGGRESASGLATWARLAGMRLPEEPEVVGADAEPPVAGAPGDPGATSAERAEAAFRLATLLRHRRAEDSTDPTERAAARVAVEGKPQDAAARLLLAAALLPKTDVAAERETNPARREIETALELDPENAVACALLHEHYTRILPIPREARRWLDRAIAIAPQNPTYQFALARRLADVDLPAEAARVERIAAALPGADGYAPLLEALGARELEAGQASEAEKRLRGAIARDRSSARAFSTLQSLLLSQGRVDEALSLLDEARAAEPFSTDLALRRAHLLRVRGRMDDALATIQEALVLCPEDSSIHARLAHERVRAGDTEGAVSALETAVALDPKDRTSTRYLEHLRVSVRPFEEAFRVDARAFVADPPSGIPAESVAAADEPYEVLFQQVAYRLNPDGTTQRYEHFVARVRNEEGARRLDTFGVAHDFFEEQVRIRRARVLRADGRIDDAPSPPGSGWVRFPPLAAGDTIDVEARIDTVRTGFFGNYFGARHPFHGLGLASTRRSEQIYVVPAGRPLHFLRRNGAPEPEVSTDETAENGAGTTTYRFVLESLRRPVAESAMPDATEFVPTVAASTYGSWDEFAAWWWNLIQKECQSSPGIREKVAELVRGKETAAAKVRAVYDFVANDIRYNAWEFGVHGYKPYNAATIFDRRHGDCKDKAILLKTMLAEIGIEAHPVLIHADERRPIEDLSIPMVGLFNHCIAWLPATGDLPETFLDGTARNHPADVLPDMDRGATVVIVKDGKPILARTGYPSPEENLDALEADFALRADGSASGSIVMRPRGRFDVRVRETFGSEKGAQKENLERWISGMLGRTRVVELETTDLRDLETPVELRATVEVEKLARSRGSHLVLPVHLSPRRLLTAASEAQRSYDLLLGPPEVEEERVTYRLPEGIGALSLPADDATESDFGAFAVTAAREGSSIVVRSRSSVATPRVTPKDYEGFRSFARALDEAQSREIVVRSEP